MKWSLAKKIVGGLIAILRVRYFWTWSLKHILTDTGIRAIRGYPKRIQSYNEARSIRGVGDKTALKVRTFHP